MSDELGLLAHPRPAIIGGGVRGLVAAVTRIVEEDGIGEVIVGLPLSMSGAFTDQTIRARKIADTLSGGLKVRVSTFDERLTTVQARRSKRGKVRRDGTLDSAAATILLQAVIDKRNGGISS